MNNFKVPPPPQIQGGNVVQPPHNNSGAYPQGNIASNPNQVFPVSFPYQNLNQAPSPIINSRHGPNMPLGNQMPPDFKTEEMKDSSEKISCLKNGKFFEALETKYRCKIDLYGTRIKINSDQQHIETIKREITNKIGTLPFTQNGKWFYLDNSGVFIEYETGINNLIEKKYKAMYLVIHGENYQDYQEFVEFERQNNKYACYFARPGGVHCQKMVVNSSLAISDIRETLLNKDVTQYNFNHLTIREVRRRVGNEEEKIDRQLNFEWKWKHEDGSFRDYTYHANYIIEDCYKKYLETGQTVDSFAIIQGDNGKSYQIYFNNMIQYNEVTRFSRTIERRDKNSH